VTAKEGSRCTKGIYGDRDETSISVNNTNIVPDGEGLFYFSYIDGKGIQVDVSCLLSLRIKIIKIQKQNS
jgi:hypothetical protein